MTIQRRLLLLLVVVGPLVWVVAAGLAWSRARHEIDELFDTQQVRFARQLLGIGLPAGAEPAEVQTANPGPRAQGEAELETLAVALWIEGRRVLRDDDGPQLPYEPDVEGFVDLTLEGGNWRVYYLRGAGSPKRLSAVGTNLAERDEVAETLVTSQMLPWLAMLPVLLVALAWAARTALSPLRHLVRQVERRGADDLAPIDAAHATSDLRPLIASMNGLFRRIDEAMQRERRFTADAAHELRTPIAALRAQWDAIGVAGEDNRARDRAIGGVRVGIDRLERLVSQVMWMAQADAADGGTDARRGWVPADWDAIARGALDACLPLIEERDAEVDVVSPPAGAATLPLTGNATLLEAMLRNLVDNAIRYGPPSGRVTIRLQPASIAVEDEGPGLEAHDLDRLGERFHRMATPATIGSGLGVSISKRIAALHGLRIRFEQRRRAEGVPGLRAVIERAGA
jgi:two-component system sensor histidine kinase QseC